MQVYETHAVQWASLKIEVRYCADWLTGYTKAYGYPLAHLEIDAGGAALPITETGYKSRFDRADTIEAAGGAVAFVLAWLDEAAATPEWQAGHADRQQLSLF